MLERRGRGFERAAIKANHDAMRLRGRVEGSNNVEGFFNVATRCCSLAAPLPLSFVVAAAALDVTRGWGERGVGNMRQQLLQVAHFYDICDVTTS